MEQEYLNPLDTALDIGERTLAEGGSSLDAVERVIRYLEDNPLFNAGKGAVFSNAGYNDLDASIMDGATQNAGAVAGLRTVRNPISAARAVLEKSDHVILSGEGADAFAASQGLEIVDPGYFHTDRRWEALQKVRARELQNAEMSEADKHGTVGCVALDKFGNLAAGTSTGGMTNKRFGRVGDSPIIGAGTYADNVSCAVSCTGHGEYFIRYAVAHEVAARVEHTGVSVRQAAEEVVLKKLVEKGGSGGLIALDRGGNIAMVFNSEGMYRGFAKPGERVVKIYAD